ncbi:LysE family translocator [Neptunicella sp. SCSIO 80796]|uniref:LysE family translocator n=1 Tax=Neptunicella plasticusilytica TaxID=3117012 RepID=UPI003A4D4EAE
MSLFLAMSLYSISLSLTPGPVNLITFTSGINYGVKRTLPFVTGATMGFILLLYTIGLGLTNIITDHTHLMMFLATSGSIYIAYLGYRIATSVVELEVIQTEAPDFKTGVLLQWLNPKAWVACVAGVSAFELTNAPQQLVLFIGIYCIWCFLCIACWAILGDRIGRRWRNVTLLTYVNRIMGGLLFLVALYLVFQQWDWY